MFLKDIRDSIPTIPFIALSSSMKSSLSEIFFSILNSSIILNSLLLKKLIFLVRSLNRV